jgi:hypothetical protein
MADYIGLVFQPGYRPRANRIYQVPILRIIPVLN